MNNLRSLKKGLLLFFFLIPISIWAQFELNIRPLHKKNYYGVFVRVEKGYNPSPKTTTGSGQITILIPNNGVVEDIKSINGNWPTIDLVKNPIENPFIDYLSIGFAPSEKKIPYNADQEILLIALKISLLPGDSLSLINNETDAFAQIPNSIGTNPGNDLSAVDPLDNYRIYQYTRNYDYPTRINYAKRPFIQFYKRKYREN